MKVKCSAKLHLTLQEFGRRGQYSHICVQPCDDEAEGFRVQHRQKFTAEFGHDRRRVLDPDMLRGSKCALLL